jgi:hypothetical protein
MYNGNVTLGEGFSNLQNKIKWWGGGGGGGGSNTMVKEQQHHHKEIRAYLDHEINIVNSKDN